MDGICIVCDEALGKYDNIHQHLFKNPSKMLDSNHVWYANRIKDNGYKDPCFCGNEIIQNHTGTRYCSKCDYIWAES